MTDFTNSSDNFYCLYWQYLHFATPYTYFMPIGGICMFERINTFKNYLLDRAPSTNFTATALSEALFPKGSILESPDSEKIAAQASIRGYDTALWGVELHALLTKGHLFSKLDTSARTSYLNHYISHPLVGSYLKLISLPLKYAYLNDEKLFSQLKIKNGVRVPSETEKHRWQRQIIDVDDYLPPKDSAEDFEVDVVVIGTGAGGAAAAYELASQGLAVLIIEEGKYLNRKDFTGKIPEMVNKLYRANGATGAIGNTIIPIPIGRNVGGTTTINSGTCIRAPNEVLEQWQREGLTDFNKENMEKYFSRVEGVLQVQNADERYVGEILRVIDRGADKIIHGKGHVLKRNAVGCDGQGLCQFGCPTDAKQSTNVSFIPRALESGALLLTGFRANKIIWDGNQVAGIEAEGIKNKNGHKIKTPLTIKTRHVVVAMGSLITPLFLRKNGVNNKHTGRNLSIHPAGAVTARFKNRTFDHANLIPQGYGVATMAKKGLMLEGATPPLMAYGMLLPSIGEQFVKETENYKHTAFFGFMIKDKSRGRVRKGLFEDIPLVTYSMNDEDFKLFLEGISTLVKMYLAAGAEEVRIAGCNKKSSIKNEQELEQLMAMKLRPRDFLISAFHPLGTARIGASPKIAVCDQDHQVFGKSGLYVMDGSSVPSSLGANPQVTIMAMATRAAEKLGKKIQLEYESN